VDKLPLKYGALSESAASARPTPRRYVLMSGPP
jgi:hypothetical protein